VTTDSLTFPTAKDHGKTVKLMDAAELLKLYHADRPDQTERSFDDAVKSWALKMAAFNGWESIEFIDDQVLLKTRPAAPTQSMAALTPSGKSPVSVTKAPSARASTGAQEEPRHQHEFYNQRRAPSPYKSYNTLLPRGLKSI